MEELASVTAGKPINSAMLPGERWFIVDARWMDHWLEFCTSKRRMAPPGPVDNSWMLHSDKRCVRVSHAAAAAVDCRCVVLRIAAVWVVLLFIVSHSEEMFGSADSCGRCLLVLIAAV